MFKLTQKTLLLLLAGALLLPALAAAQIGNGVQHRSVPGNALGLHGVAE